MTHKWKHTDYQVLSSSNNTSISVQSTSLPMRLYRSQWWRLKWLSFFFTIVLFTRGVTAPIFSFAVPKVFWNQLTTPNWLLRESPEPKMGGSRVALSLSFFFDFLFLFFFKKNERIDSKLWLIAYIDCCYRQIGREKAHVLRSKGKAELLKQLADWKKELAELRVAKVTGGAAAKLSKM